MFLSLTATLKIGDGGSRDRRESEMRQQKNSRTDLGTVLLHWGTVLTLIVSLVTGLRIAADSPGLSWLLYMGAILPQGAVWRVHLLAGLALTCVAVAYAIYITRARLSKRIKLDHARLSGLAHHGKARWAAVNVALYWALYGALTLQAFTGVLLYLGYGNTLVTAHFAGAMALLAFPALHVGLHYLLGGANQLLRIFRPTSIEQPKSVQSFIDILLEHYVAKNTNPEPPPQREVKSHGVSLHAHPLAVAGAAALAAAFTVLTADFASDDQLTIARIADSQVPRVDGDISDTAWQLGKPLVIETNQGVNFGGTGTSSVEVRAVHSDKFVFFAFTWEDPSRSLKHLPLIKTEDGWRVLQEKYDIEDEDSYYEDKFAVMFSRSSEMGGGGTAHLGAKPLSSLPAAYSSRGLHYTTDDSIVDVWHWKAARGGLFGWVDDNYFGPPAKPKPEEVAGTSRYKAGYATDPGKAVYSNNFAHEPQGGYRRPVEPKRLPISVESTTTAMGRIDLDPNHGEAEATRWWMTEAESQPYSSDIDTNIPVGTIIPGVLVAGTYEGDRADIKGAAHWAAGRWTLELFRQMDTGTKYDVPFESGISMWVAAFDHSQTRHTRHLKPITLEVEQ
jgi:cytochrome b subunit of formate dehydrogenase